MVEAAILSYGIMIYQQGDIYPEGQLCDAQAFLMSYFGKYCQGLHVQKLWAHD